MSKSKIKITSQILVGSLFAATTMTAVAGGTIKLGDDKSISIGMGIRTAFNANEDVKNFAIEEARVYLSGQLNKTSKFTFNTKEIGGNLVVLDAIIQYEPSKAFNFWMGRMLTPADRIEMNGPFYALSWNQYNVPLFPSDQGGQAGLRGRDDGATIWGAINKFQYAVGVFNGLRPWTDKAGIDRNTNANENLLFAGRFAYNFLNMESNPGYYTSSTYYGSLGDILTVAVSGQQQTKGAGTTANQVDFKGAAIDVLYETKLSSGDVITVEGEYKVMDANASAGFVPYDGTSYFATAAYMLGKSMMGKGKLQPYVRYVNNETSANVKSTTTEVGLNCIISAHNLRFNLNVMDGDATIGGGKAGKSTTTVSFGMQQQF